MSIHERLSEILAPYRGQTGTLIPILQKTQEELGYLTEEAISEIARFSGVSESQVYGVASFYAQFRFTRQGEHVIKVCQGTACHVRGGSRLVDKVQRDYGIKPGETTEDAKFTLETVNCLGCCALGPVVVVDGKYESQMNPDKLDRVIRGFK